MSVRILNHYIGLTAIVQNVLILIAGQFRFEVVLITATSNGKFLFALNIDRMLLYRFFGRLCTNEFFAKVFTLSFLHSLFLFPLLIF